jgi:hypothetical protein
MLALTDAAFARLCIRATAVPQRARSSWLRQLARTIEKRAGTRKRVASHRARERNGVRLHKLPIPNVVMEDLIDALVAAERLTEADALRDELVDAALVTLMSDIAKRWGECNALP